MTEVSPIKPVGPKPDVDVIEFIEKLLARAKAGELLGIACVTVTTERCTGAGWCNIGDNVMQVLGSIDVMHRDIMDLDVELRIDPETGDRRD